MEFEYKEPIGEVPLFFPLADLNHHAKYLGRGGRGRSELCPSTDPQPNAAYVPSPVDVVRSGAEPVNYLDSFSEDSYWNDEIQAFKKSEGIPTDAAI